MSSEQLHELVCTAAGITNVVTKHGFCCLMAEAKCTTDWVICSQVFTCLGDGIRQEFLPSAVTLHRGQLLACPRLLTGFRPWSSPPLGWPLRFMAICCRVSEVAIAARVVVVSACLVMAGVALPSRGCTSPSCAPHSYLGCSGAGGPDQSHMVLGGGSWN